jgi:hypothetical protein
MKTFGNERTCRAGIARTSKNNACGDTKPLVDERHMSQVDKVSMKQEATGSLVQW